LLQRWTAANGRAIIWLVFATRRIQRECWKVRLRHQADDEDPVNLSGARD